MLAKGRCSVQASSSHPRWLTTFRGLTPSGLPNTLQGSKAQLGNNSHTEPGFPKGVSGSWSSVESPCRLVSLQVIEATAVHSVVWHSLF